MPNKIIYNTLRRLLRAGEDTIPKLYIRLMLPDAPVIVDAGAHVGGDTQEMSRLWPRATIHAFEPVPDLFRQLTANTAGLGNVHRHPLALGAETGAAQMFVSGGGSDASSSLLMPKEVLQINPHVLFGGRITVPTTTLDAWAQENDVGRIDFLWLDMQGAELRMLEAAPRILAGVQAIHLEVSLMEFYEASPLYAQVRMWLEDRGFRLEAEEIVQSQAGEPVGGNALFLRPGVRVRFSTLLRLLLGKAWRTLAGQ